MAHDEYDTDQWDKFDPAAYCDHNYDHVWPEDEAIIAHLAATLPGLLAGRRPGRAVDLGAGSNLYPTLSLLPFIESIDLCDVGEMNLDWLRSEVTGYGRRWDQYWEMLQTYGPEYRSMAAPRSELAARARVIDRSLFDAPPSHYDIGLMFFVAESITDSQAVFEEGLIAGCLSIAPGGVFVAAFMARSVGYDVAGLHFPAVSIDESDVARTVAPHLHVDLLVTIESSVRIREGYGGMILLVGTRLG